MVSPWHHDPMVGQSQGTLTPWHGDPPSWHRLIPRPPPAHPGRAHPAPSPGSQRGRCNGNHRAGSRNAHGCKVGGFGHTHPHLQGHRSGSGHPRTPASGWVAPRVPTDLGSQCWGCWGGSQGSRGSGNSPLNSRSDHWGRARGCADTRPRLGRARGGWVGARMGGCLEGWVGAWRGG